MVKLFICLFGIVVLSGCNHLLYPAERRAYFEASKVKPEPQQIKIPVGNANEGAYLHAWYFPAQSKIKKGLAVHFHGNGQNLTTHFMFFRWIIDFGYDYLIFDYRGYGASSDEQATQEKTVEDGVAVFKYISEKFMGTPTVAIGQSLGSNVLVRTLQELNKNENDQRLLPAVVVLDSSFLSYKEAASSTLSQKWFMYPFKPFAYLLISDEWAASKQMQHTPNIPALYFHGTNDFIIDYGLGLESFNLWKGPKVILTQQEGKHTSAFDDVRFINESRVAFLSCADAAIKKDKQFVDCLSR